jgi:S1-C subfamily serine protease
VNGATHDPSAFCPDCVRERGRRGRKDRPRGWSGPRPVGLIVLALFVVALALAVMNASRQLDATATAGSTGPLAGLRGSAARVSPGLVDINVSFALPGVRGAGTGMVLTPGGVVLTNNHVIDGATHISATSLGTGRTYAATVVGYSAAADVAVLRLSGAQGLPTVPTGRSGGVAAGSRVSVIGNAGGDGDAPTVAHGVVTGLDRAIVARDSVGQMFERLTGLIATDASVVGGDSGGPLVDSSGRVIGMVTASSAEPGTRAGSPAAGFAIPIDTALAVAAQIRSGRASATVHIGPTAFLGVAIVRDGATDRAATIKTEGAVVGTPLPGYPAAAAGLAQGDVITSVDGQAVSSGASLSDLLGPRHPGDTVRLEWVDPAGQTHAADVRLAAGPPG